MYLGVARHSSSSIISSHISLRNVHGLLYAIYTSSFLTTAS
jgi:hypothetical protein